jgi:putative protease
MKIAVTPFDVNSINKLSENGAEIFIVGNDKYANRLVKSYSEVEISEACELIKSLKKEVYIQMNLIVHNENIPEFDRFLDFVKTLDVNGIIFGDLAVYNLAKRKDMIHLLIYNPETLNTNYYDPIFWNKKGIKGLTISKEITLKDIQVISKNSKIDISLTGHGHLNMFHSRRPLIENFFKFKTEEYNSYVENRNLHLVEEIRNESYPVFQDIHGTHIFRDKAMESYQEINILSNSLDVFIIDGIFKDSDYLIKTLDNYTSLILSKDISKAKMLSEFYQKDHDSGFLYKKTVYDKY